MEFDKTSFEIELADLMDKFRIKNLAFCRVREDYFVNTYDNKDISIGYEITPKSLRNGSKA